jgi:uncharacterized protein (DUF849 family)
MTLRPAPGTLITVAPTGAEHLKADLPQLPSTLDELVETAERSEEAGAALIHIHRRDADHQPTLDLGLLREGVAAVRERTDLIVQLSTGGSVHDPLSARLAVLDADPDSCSLTCGTVNFGDDVFLNPMPFMSDLYVLAQERQVVPEFEIFEMGHLASLERLVDRHGLPHGGAVHIDIVLGVPGALPATPAVLHAVLAALPECVTSWSATGMGRGHLPILASAIAAGGHARVGIEDNIVFAKGRPVAHNAELVARAAEVARLLQRPAMTADAARDYLGITDRRTR